MKSLNYKKYNLLLSLIFIPCLLFGQESYAPRSSADISDSDTKKVMKKSSASDYVQNHADVKDPFSLMGGAINIEIMQSEGGVFVALPDNRELDPIIFGTPEKPKKFGGTPVVTGVPVELRNTKDGNFTTLNKKSPFGDKHAVMNNGRLMINAMDKTATDAATTEDKVKLSASWEDENGNTYEVRCCKMMATHGIDFPTYGGVATNLVLHGFSGNGTPLMPSEYTYFAFWGIGEVIKNGKTVDKPRLIHGMLTEYVRTDGYKLAFDKNVTPERRHFHLLTVPAKPNLKEFSFETSPVNTGYVLPNDKELPFWHVMFENLDISSNRVN